MSDALDVVAGAFVLMFGSAHEGKNGVAVGVFKLCRSIANLLLKLQVVARKEIAVFLEPKQIAYANGQVRAVNRF